MFRIMILSPLCGKTTYPCVEIPHRNITKDYNNSTLDNYADAEQAADAANGQINESFNEQSVNNHFEYRT